MMPQIEETQLFFLAHLEGGRGYTDLQMICQAMENLRAYGHLYVKALAIWLREDPAHCMVWTISKDCMYQQYERMLQERGGGTLVMDGYGGDFNAIASEDTAILTESLVNYAKQSTRTSAQVDKLWPRLEAMVIQQQPRVENFAHDAVY